MLELGFGKRSWFTKDMQASGTSKGQASDFTLPCLMVLQGKLHLPKALDLEFNLMMTTTWLLFYPFSIPSVVSKWLQTWETTGLFCSVIIKYLGGWTGAWVKGGLSGVGGRNLPPLQGRQQRKCTPNVKAMCRLLWKPYGQKVVFTQVCPALETRF